MIYVINVVLINNHGIRLTFKEVIVMIYVGKSMVIPLYINS